MTSKIKVDNIADQDDNNIINESGDVITVGAAGDTVAVAGNIVKSNAYQASDGGNIVSQSGTTVTLGASGDTVTLASGASQSGFGRTGTVDWQTGSIKTATFTAANGEGYFCNTTSSAFTVNLPSSPSAGNIVSIADYAGTAATNNITIGRNGSNIEGLALDSLIDVNREARTLIYVDATQGWVAVNTNDSATINPAFVTATGGNSVTTSGNFKIHTFTGPGTFTVSCAGNPLGSSTVDYLVVAGGGAGGQGKPASGGGSGGGAGGYRESSGAASGCYSIGLPANSGVAALPVSAQGYPITVGAGGGPGSGCGQPGGVSTFSTITSAGGGGGGGGQGPDNGQDGGSGAGRNSGNTPPVSPPQGNDGGANQGGVAGGGGGASEAGQRGPSVGSPTQNYGQGGRGGAGANSSITASPVAYAGGGGGGGYSGGPQGANSNGGAASPCGTGGQGKPVTNGTTNRGGGGGGNGGGDGEANAPHGTGGSGIVVIRYKFQ